MLHKYIETFIMHVKTVDLFGSIKKIWKKSLIILLMKSKDRLSIQKALVIMKD